MKIPPATVFFLCGVLFGVSLMLCLGATNQPVEPPRREPVPLQITSYPSGTTGIFDVKTGRLYMYDINLEHCYTIREITRLGDPMRKLR